MPGWCIGGQAGDGNRRELVGITWPGVPAALRATMTEGTVDLKRVELLVYGQVTSSRGESQVGTVDRGGAFLVLVEKRSEYAHEQGIRHYDCLGGAYGVGLLDLLVASGRL